MRLRTDVIGALNLFSTTPEPLSPEDQQVAQALADIATIGILQERALSDGHIVTSQLQGALESRIVIEQAKGIVAEHNHVSVDDAFTLLRGYARNPQPPAPPDRRRHHQRDPHHRRAHSPDAQPARLTASLGRRADHAAARYIVVDTNAGMPAQ